MWLGAWLHVPPCAPPREAVALKPHGKMAVCWQISIFRRNETNCPPLSTRLEGVIRLRTRILWHDERRTRRQMSFLFSADYYEVRKNGISPAQNMAAYLGGSAIQTVGDNPVTAYRQLVQQFAKGLDGSAVDLSLIHI